MYYCYVEKPHPPPPSCVYYIHLFITSTLRFLSEKKFSIVENWYIIVVHVNGHDRTITEILAKYCIELPDDGSLVIRNMLEHF